MTTAARSRKSRKVSLQYIILAICCCALRACRLPVAVGIRGVASSVSDLRARFGCGGRFGAAAGGGRRTVTFDGHLEAHFLDGKTVTEDVKLAPARVQGVDFTRTYKVSLPSNETDYASTPLYRSHEENVRLGWTGDTMVGHNGKYGSLRSVDSTLQSLTFRAESGSSAGTEITVQADQVLKLRANPANPEDCTTSYQESRLAQGACIMILKGNGSWACCMCSSWQRHPSAHTVVTRAVSSRARWPGHFTLRNYSPRHRRALASSVRIRLSAGNKVSPFTRLYHGDVWMFGDELVHVTKLPCVVSDRKVNVVWNK